MSSPDPLENQPNHWQDLAAGYAAGDLDSAEAEDFQRLLEDQPALDEDTKQLQAIASLMRYSPSSHSPPAALRDRILQQAQATPQEIISQANQGYSSEAIGQADLPPQRQRLSRRWLYVGGSMAATAILALGVDNVLLRQSLHHNEQLANLQRQSLQQNEQLANLLRQPNAQLYALQGTEKQRNASARLVIEPQQSQATIVTQELRPLPAGEAYRLWAVVKNESSPVFCGQFNSGGKESVVQWQLPSASCKVPQKLLITAELASAKPIPAGPLILKQ